jgi:hypothetical protein
MMCELHKKKLFNTTTQTAATDTHTHTYYYGNASFLLPPHIYKIYLIYTIYYLYSIIFAVVLYCEESDRYFLHHG